MNSMNIETIVRISLYHYCVAVFSRKWSIWVFINVFVDIPLRVILTKVDTLDLCIPGDLSGIYKSKQMADKVRLGKNKFELQESQILPIASYVQETRQNITKDVLALQAVENILNEALGYVKNQVPGLI